MKSFDRKNYALYKRDMSNIYNSSLKVIDILDRKDLLIRKYFTLPETVARSFSLDEMHSGVLSLDDLIQEGFIGLLNGIDSIDVDEVVKSDNPEVSVRMFLVRRIHGAIRRSVDYYRGSIRLSEYMVNKIRKAGDKDYNMAQMFFNCIFDRLEDRGDSNKVEDKTLEYNHVFVTKYIIGLVDRYLDADEARIIKDMYGLDGNKKIRREIANDLGIKDLYQLDKIRYSAIDKLSKNVDRELVLDFLNEG